MTKFKENNEIAKKINQNQNVNFIKSFAQKNNLEVKELLILGLNDNKKFKTNVIRRIFETKDGETHLISDNTFSDNFIIFIEKTNLKKFDKNSPKYIEYSTRAKLNFAQNIYGAYDKSLNSKYQIKVNEGVLNRIKKFFLMITNLNFKHFKKSCLHRSHQTLFKSFNCNNYKKIENIFQFLLSEKDSFIFESVEKGKIKEDSQ